MGDNHSWGPLGMLDPNQSYIKDEPVMDRSVANPITSVLEYMNEAAWATSWMSDAECRDNLELMFAEGDEVMVSIAKALCDRCPIVSECLTWGMNEEYGIFGGKTSREREAMTHAT